MPITRSAKRALRQSQRRYQRNLAKKKALKEAVKKFKKSLAPADLSLAFKKLDKAAKTHLIHSNKAARLKSKLAQLIVKSKSAVS